jgi:hypothetical protein
MRRGLRNFRNTADGVRWRSRVQNLHVLRLEPLR